MIVPLKFYSEHIVGFRCSGRVTKDEYDTVLIPMIEKALETQRRVRLYFETTPHFSIELGAVWDDFRFGIERFTRWERFALVTDVDWLKQSTRVFSFLLPARVRIFPSAEAQMARAWIAAHLGPAIQISGRPNEWCQQGAARRTEYAT
jgi:SpoIIAA-like